MRKVYLLLDNDNDVTICNRGFRKTEGVVLSPLEVKSLTEELMYAYIRKQHMNLSFSHADDILIKHKELKDLIYDFILFSKYLEELEYYYDYKTKLIDGKEVINFSIINNLESKLEYINTIKRSVLSPFRKEAFDIKAIDMNIWATCEVSFRKINKKVKEKVLNDKEEELKKEKEAEIDEKMFENQFKDFIK